MRIPILRNNLGAVIVIVAVLLSGCNQTKDSAVILKHAPRKSIPAKNVVCPTNAASCVVNATGDDKLFFEAIAGNNIALIKSMLQKNNRFLSIRTILDATPLHVAVTAGNPQCISALINAGADVNIANKQGRTPLHIAATTGNLAIIKILIGNKASVSPISRSMNTPLHDAAAKGNLEIVKYLIAKGASINSVNNRGATPLKTATKNNHKDISKFLISKGANKAVFCCADL